jgi:hypothetical protein
MKGATNGIFHAGKRTWPWRTGIGANGRRCYTAAHEKREYKHSLVARLIRAARFHTQCFSL